eukprot:CAMPEP_0196742110 /NCGR_PEP_ID=MMETSP1091-20130531/44620_1 /TAXON_ID=302021 /ORGANISM="Rhodomonas sp., Strain CCMP768" /LENGTH=236 /DNA_ID=CAMNT_0042088057 /DNA_START=52 /DNA_END=758 /DNA_ORIENTATION=+
MRSASQHASLQLNVNFALSVPEHSREMNAHSALGVEDGEEAAVTPGSNEMLSLSVGRAPMFHCPAFDSVNGEVPQRDVLIRPRASPGSGTQRAKKQIKITLDILQSLFGMPLKEAASVAGISISAFKRVCRHLGVRAWPYRFQDTLPHLVQRPQQEESSTENTLQSEICGEDTPNAEDVRIKKEEEELAQLLQCSKHVWAHTPPCDAWHEEPPFHSGWLVSPVDWYSVEGGGGGGG